MTSLPTQQAVADDLNLLPDALPPHVIKVLKQEPDIGSLLEIVMDLGRLPAARFLNRELALDTQEVTLEDLAYVTGRIGEFGQDNRAGIERTLHRISAIRNRKGKVVGITCRVGRAIFGTIKVIEDLVSSGKSVLILGRPGVGKTTMLREVARVLADQYTKRVVIVDTSNEIAGDGDIPHPGIGKARRMQVPTPSLQHEVMIEAVENHMPEVVVIDEIGREAEALAARTIAERGVQLIATAHGTSLENLMMNPTLADLIGGIQSVTLGDEEARRRGTQKSILERKAPPTFDSLWISWPGTGWQFMRTWRQRWTPSCADRRRRRRSDGWTKPAQSSAWKARRRSCARPPWRFATTRRRTGAGSGSRAARSTTSTAGPS